MAGFLVGRPHAHQKIAWANQVPNWGVVSEE